MKLDPVLAEIRATRESYSERFGGDVSAMLADLRKREQQSGRKLVSRPPQRVGEQSGEQAVSEHGLAQHALTQQASGGCEFPSESTRS
jgi:hypothetical protein